MNEIYDLEDVTEEKQEFVCDSDLKAEWLIKKIKENETECQRLTDIINQEIEILENKKQKLQNDLTNKNGWLKGRLVEYFDTVEKRELKSCFKYDLPSGSLILKKASVQYERDNEKILNWLTENNKYEYIKTNPTVDWSSLKANEDITKIDGVTAIPVEARFEVR